MRPDEVKVPENVDISQIAAGSNHSAIVSTTGDVYTFGRGSSGELGHCSLLPMYQPTKVRVCVCDSGQTKTVKHAAIIRQVEFFSSSCRTSSHTCPVESGCRIASATGTQF